MIVQCVEAGAGRLLGQPCGLINFRPDCGAHLFQRCCVDQVVR
jgi:hypothetical protein